MLAPKRQATHARSGARELARASARLNILISCLVNDDYYEDLPGNDYCSDIVSLREGFNSRSGILTWKKYHPLEDHLKYHEYLLEEYPKLVKVT